jgi:hypothetical protein
MWVDNDVPTLKNFYRLPFSKWMPQYRTNSTLSDFNEISYLGRLWCPELIPDIKKSTHISNFDDIGQCWIFTPHFYAVFWQKSWKFWKRRIAPLMVTYHLSNFKFSPFIPRTMNLSTADLRNYRTEFHETCCHFQNGRHNTAQIQHCPISTKFHI